MNLLAALCTANLNPVGRGDQKLAEIKSYLERHATVVLGRRFTHRERVSSIDRSGMRYFINESLPEDPEEVYGHEYTFRWRDIRRSFVFVEKDRSPLGGKYARLDILVRPDARYREYDARDAFWRIGKVLFVEFWFRSRPQAVHFYGQLARMAELNGDATPPHNLLVQTGGPADRDVQQPRASIEKLRPHFPFGADFPREPGNRYPPYPELAPPKAE